MKSDDQRASLELSAKSARVSLVIIAIAAALGTLWWLKPVLIPLALAWLVKVAFTPVVRWARKHGVQPALSAGLIILGGIGALVGTGFLLVGPAEKWMARLPRDIKQLAERVESMREGELERNVEEVKEAIGELAETTGMAKKDDDYPLGLEVKVDSGSTMTKQFVGKARVVLAQFLLMAVLAFLMLANDRVLLSKWVAAARTTKGKRRAVRAIRAVETHCSRYLLTITVINIILGAGVALVCIALGVPEPFLWGVMATVLNFIPFLGAAIGVVVVLFVGATTSESLLFGMLPALGYLTLTCLEGMLITPMIIGRQIKLSSVVVLTWLILWGWLWGLAGALLALPMLAAIVMMCRHVPEWRPLAELLEA